MTTVAIKTYREQAGLTQTRLAEALRLNQGYISQIENGEKKPSLEIAQRIADFFGVGVDDLWINAPSTPESEPATVVA